MVIPTKYKDLHGWTDCVDSFIWVVKQTDKMHIASDRAITGPADLGRENAASGQNDSICLINNHVDFDTYWTIY